MKKNIITHCLLLLFCFHHQIVSANSENLLHHATTQESLPNESGEIIIVMYHGVEKYKPREIYNTYVAQFKEDLEVLYQNGYRLITMEDLINNEIKIKKGYKPVILTFDDGLPSSFSLTLDPNGCFKPKKNCAVDLIEEFARKHPDFGKTAVFFIHGTTPFKGEGRIIERMQYLVENGYEIGNHSFSHKDFSRSNKKNLQKEIGALDEWFTNCRFQARAIAYPFGKRPSKKLYPYVLKGEYEGHSYTYDLAFRAAPSSTSSNPCHILFDPINMPRIRGSKSTHMDLRWFINYYIRNPEQVYVSDGNPHTITVPKEKAELINPDLLGNKELILY